MFRQTYVGICRAFDRSFWGLTFCLRIPCFTAAKGRDMARMTGLEMPLEALGDFRAIESWVSMVSFWLVLTHCWNATNTFHRPQCVGRDSPSTRGVIGEKKRKTDDLYSGPDQTSCRSLQCMDNMAQQYSCLGNYGGICWLPSQRRYPPTAPTKEWDQRDQSCSWVPSGNLTVCYWKWPSRNSGFSHEKWWIFQFAMLVYQRLNSIDWWPNPMCSLS